VGPGERDLPFQIGQVVADRYRIVRLLGRGGMGAIFEAEHTELRRLVALKVLLPRLAGDVDAVARFFREARAAAAIGHPGIVQVFDLGSRDGVAFLAMERLQGEELAQRVARLGPLPPGFVARVGRDLADAVAAAHDCGIVHRDLKPQNVFLARDARGIDVVKVLDFGIAKLTEADRADQPLTQTGAVFGTPMYMPPEQLRGVKDLDGRADIYAIGAILYECLMGSPPFAAESFPMLVLRITTEPPRPIDTARTDVPRELVAVVSKALAKLREERYGNAHELAAALGAIAAVLPEPTMPPPPEVVPPAELAALATAPTVASKPVTPAAPETSPAHGGAIPRTEPRTTMPAKGQGTEERPEGVAASEPPAPAASETPLAWSSVVPPPPRSRRRSAVLALAVLVLVAGGAGIGVWVSQGDDGPPATSAVPGPPKAHPVVRIRSSPPGAEVRLGGAILCRTPCDRALPEGDTADLSAVLDGYVPARTVLSAPFPAEYTFVLTALPAAAPEVAPPSAPPPEAPPRVGPRKAPPSSGQPDLPPLRNR